MDYKTNLENAVGFILDSVLDVELVIPEVVKAKFSSKLG
jgi:hypothetical protein